MFDCKKLHTKCKAVCCKSVPIEKAVYERNVDKIIQAPISTEGFEGVDGLENRTVSLIFPITKNGYCPFLREDLLCNIQDDKPSVCVKYGSEIVPCLKCPFQDKNGRVRARQETRLILRKAKKTARNFIRKAEKHGSKISKEIGD